MRGQRPIFPARDGSPSTLRIVASAAPTSSRSRSQSPDHADRRRLFRLARGLPRHGCRCEGQAGIIAVAPRAAKDASFRRPACTSGTLMKRFQSRPLRKFSDHDDDRYLIDRQVGARMPVAAFAERMYEAEPTPDAKLQLRQEIAQRAHRLVRRVGKARKRSARRDHSPRRLSSQSRWAAWFSTASRTTSSPRPNRSRSGRRMCRPVSTSPTIRCFRPQFLVSRHADQTARLDKFHAPSDQRAEMPIPPLSAGRNMAMRNPVDRVNYQPNSFGEGPRESPQRGFRSFPEAEEGQKVRLRAASFADHYSQACQFFNSQAAPEQKHIAMALTLSKVETLVIRERMIRTSLTSTRGWPKRSPTKLGIKELPRPVDTAVAPRDDLAPSPALSIVGNGPGSIAGRKVGVLVSPGADAALLKAADSDRQGRGDDGNRRLQSWRCRSVGRYLVAAKHMTDGGPSVCSTRWPVLRGRCGTPHRRSPLRATSLLMPLPIASSSDLRPALLRCCGRPASIRMPEGLIGLGDAKAIAKFIESCRKLRLWSRETAAKL